MIKANELRVGSLVYVLYQVSTITSINESDVDSHDCKDIPIEELRPIPITEEWLVKAGFEIVDKVALHWNAEKVYAKNGYALFYRTSTVHDISGGEIQIFEDKSFQYLNGHGIITHLQYIHQLQNLYFALTGEELTIK